MLSNSNDNKKARTMERIYIGGFDPQRLAGQDIVRRVQRQFESTIDFDSVTAKEDRPFVHLHATSKDPETSAIEIISKAYNKVTWKGCRLSVQPARPHFLERLEQERQQREEFRLLALALQEDGHDDHDDHDVDQDGGNDDGNGVVDQAAAKDGDKDGDSNDNDAIENEQDGEMAAGANDESPSEQQTPPHDDITNIPRRLRIRRRFADEAFHIDTRPCEVADWSNLRRALDRMEKRRAKHAEQLRYESKLQYQRRHQSATSLPQSSLSQKKLASMSAFLNRAVHMRFVDGAAPPATAVSDEDNETTVIILPPKGRSSAGDSSSEDEDEARQAASRDGKSNKESEYVWSDSDHDSDNDDDNDDSDSDVSSESDASDDNGDGGDDSVVKKQNAVPAETKEEENGEKMVDDDIAETGSKAEAETKGKDRPKDKAKKPVPADQYQWSDDSDSDDESLEDDNAFSVSAFQNNRGPTSLQQCTSKAGEFDSAMDFGNDDANAQMELEYKYSDHHPTDMMQANERLYSTNVKNDVTMNLSILSNIFPEMSNIVPTQPRDDVDADDDNDGGASNGDASGAASARGQRDSGWSKSGLMLRYDPTKATSEKYVVHEEKEDDCDDGDEKPSNDDMDADNENAEKESGNSDGDGDGDEDEQANDKDESKAVGDDAKKETQHLYQQGKLESVFRHAREAWGGGYDNAPAGTGNQDSNADSTEQDSAARTAADDDANPGPFSFGFDLGDAPSTQAAATGAGSAFSFSFFPSTENDDKINGSTMGEEAHNKSDADAGGNDVQPSAAVASPAVAGDSQTVHTGNNTADTASKSMWAGSHRRRGLDIPQSTLDKYTEQFYAMNEGQRIANDYDGWSHDGGVLQQWKDEREQLTMDWKRKRKFAISRMEKRKRFR